MKALTPDAIKAACAGVWLAKPGSGWASRELAGVSLDSRTVKPGELFVAIRGDTHDGHDHAFASASKADMLLVERDISARDLPPERGVGVLKVTDTRRALGQIALAHRRTLGAKVIAVCGSNGKTTTVRLIDAILKTRLRGTASIKSFNNDIGVPITLLGARSSDQYVICEVGTNAPGEIAALGALVEPDVAVITSIGREHLAFLGSVEGVAREEAAILRCIRDGGLAIVPADAAPLRDYIPGESNHRQLPYGRVSFVSFGESDGADLRLTSASHHWRTDGTPELRFTVNDRAAFTLPLVGRHNARNAIAAIAVARRLGIDDECIARGLAAVNAPEMRWQRTTVAGVELINDAYNANPDSMLAALATFGELYPGSTDLHSRERRTIILGDMLELGDHAPAAHREVGEAVGRRHLCDRLIAVGTLAALAADACAATSKGTIDVRTLPTLHPSDITDLAASLLPGEVVLLKGSRGNRLERVAAALQSREAAHT